MSPFVKVSRLGPEPVITEIQRRLKLRLGRGRKLTLNEPMRSS
jgi:hypothetical protein